MRRAEDPPGNLDPVSSDGSTSLLIVGASYGSPDFHYRILDNLREINISIGEIVSKQSMVWKL